MNSGNWRPGRATASLFASVVKTDVIDLCFEWERGLPGLRPGWGLDDPQAEGVKPRV